MKLRTYQYYGTRVCLCSANGKWTISADRSGIWLLTPRNRYASDLTPDQKDALLDIARAHPHPQISPEVRRELVNSVVRGEARMEDGDGDVAMGV